MVSRLLRSSVLLIASTSALALHAQTYTPATIRIDAPAGTDTAEPLRIAALPANAPLTKEQIETALGRLADTGLFSDISYTVNAKELVIKLTPSAASQALPVRYGNLVWWKPGELEPLLEARVPLYKGQLPSAGTLTEQVEAALVDLLQQKGIHAKLTVRLVNGGGGVAATDIAVEDPRVVIGELHIQNVLPALKTPLANFANSLQGEDFDIAETYDSIHLTVADIYQNSGYLDATNTPPSYSDPRKLKDGYAVDLTTSITPGEIYRVARLNVQAVAPVTQEEVLKAAAIKVGDAASPLALRIAHGEIDTVYHGYGYLESNTTLESTKDSAAHTVAYDIATVPGELYHYSRIDISAFTPEQQATFTRGFQVAPGATANHALVSAIFHAAANLHLPKPPSLSMKLDRSTHTVVYTLSPSKGTSEQ
jgi:outer membrane protein assembly factor BamA